MGVPRLVPQRLLVSLASRTVAMALPMKKAAMKAAAMKKSGMKKAGATKARKAMKAKKVSVIAKGKGAMARVFSGKKAKTQGGLSKENLVKNKRGKVVSKKRSALSKKRFASSGLKAWSDAVKKARKELGLTGFVAIGGKSAAGKALYAKAKSLL